MTSMVAIARCLSSVVVNVIVLGFVGVSVMVVVFSVVGGCFLGGLAFHFSGQLWFSGSLCCVQKFWWQYGHLKGRYVSFWQWWHFVVLFLSFVLLCVYVF